MWATRVLDRQSLKGAISLLLFFFSEAQNELLQTKGRMDVCIKAHFQHEIKV